MTLISLLGHYCWRQWAFWRNIQILGKQLIKRLYKEQQRITKTNNKDTRDDLSRATDDFLSDTTYRHQDGARDCCITCSCLFTAQLVSYFPRTVSRIGCSEQRKCQWVSRTSWRTPRCSPAIFLNPISPHNVLLYLAGTEFIRRISLTKMCQDRVTTFPLEKLASAPSILA